MREYGIYAKTLEILTAYFGFKHLQQFSQYNRFKNDPLVFSATARTYLA